MGNLVQDLRSASRKLRRNPGFIVVSVFSLAIGIGFNTAILSLLNSTMLRPFVLCHLSFVSSNLE